MSRVAIYARVSKDDMHSENQLAQLREWCSVAGHRIVAEFIDHESGGKSAAERKQLAAMLGAAHKRRFDLLLFWALDRVTREGMRATIAYLQTLADNGIAFHSYFEPALCSDNELVRDVLLAIMSSLAKVERQRIGERTRAGLARVRAKGQRLGRPALSDNVRRRIAKLIDEQPAITAYAVSKVLSIDPKSAKKYMLDGVRP